MNSLFDEHDRRTRSRNGGTITQLQQPEFRPRSEPGSRQFYRELAAWLVSKLRESYRQGDSPARIDCTIACWKKKWNWNKDTKEFKACLNRALSRISGTNGRTSCDITVEPTVMLLMVRLESTGE